MENSKSKKLFLKFIKIFNSNFIGIFIGIITGLAINLYTNSESNGWYISSVVILIVAAFLLFGALKYYDDYSGEFETAKIGIIRNEPKKEPDSSEINNKVFEQIEKKKIYLYNLCIIFGLMFTLCSSFLANIGNNQISTKNENEVTSLKKQISDLDSILKLNMNMQNNMNVQLNKLVYIITKSSVDSNNKSPENSSELSKTKK